MAIPVILLKRISRKTDHTRRWSPKSTNPGQLIPSTEDCYPPFAVFFNASLVRSITPALDYPSTPLASPWALNLLDNDSRYSSLSKLKIKNQISSRIFNNFFSRNVARNLFFWKRFIGFLFQISFLLIFSNNCVRIKK